jgi:hypothetical protein
MSAANPSGYQIVPGKFDLRRTRLCLSRCRSSPAKYIDHVGYFSIGKELPAISKCTERSDVILVGITSKSAAAVARQPKLSQ